MASRTLRGFVEEFSIVRGINDGTHSSFSDPSCKNKSKGYEFFKPFNFEDRFYPWWSDFSFFSCPGSLVSWEETI